MGTKRKLEAAPSGASDVNNDREQISAPHKKKSKPGPDPLGRNRRALPRKNAVNPLKERIRDIKRLLGHAESMPADQRVELERELSVLQHDLEVALSENHKQTMIGRYHMVRFFEKQKAGRRLKRAQKNVTAADTPEDTAAANQELHIAEVDLNYATYFPLDLPYVGLFPSKKDDDGKERADNELTEEGVRGDREMWRMVEECTANNTLEDLRSGLLTKDRGLAIQMGISGLDDDHSPRRTDTGQEARGNVKSDVGNNHTTMEDGSSDGGFFE